MYQGSPTIPECNDGTMNWLIIDKRFSITQEQADYFKKQFYDGPKQKSGNYRDLQHTESQIGYYSFTSE
jgi:carbonic anhydrase